MADDPENMVSYPSEARLREHFIGKKLQDIATPAAIVDKAVATRNCEQMLIAAEALKVSFRPHVKTHKVIELHSAEGDPTLFYTP